LWPVTACGLSQLVACHRLWQVNQWEMRGAMQEREVLLLNP